MRCNALFGMFGSAAIFATALIGSGNAWAGQFKTLNTAALAVNGQATNISSPQNTGGTMEMELYEFTTRVGGGSYQCRIIRNNTGRTLNIRLVGVNGTIINSCSAANLGTCSTPAIGLASNNKFLCLVATQFGVTAGGSYQMAVRRTL